MLHLLNYYIFTSSGATRAIRVDPAVSLSCIRHTVFVFKSIDLSVVSGSAFVIRHSCYDASGPWIGTKLRYLVIMRTSSPHDSPSSQKAACPVSSTDWIYRCSFSPSPSPLRPKLCYPSAHLDPPLHLLNFNHSSDRERERERGGWEAAGWGGFRKTQQVTELTGNTHSIYSVQSPNPPWDKLKASILSNNCWKVSSLLVKQYRQYFN